MLEKFDWTETSTCTEGVHVLGFTAVHDLTLIDSLPGMNRTNLRQSIRRTSKGLLKNIGVDVESSLGYENMGHTDIIIENIVSYADAEDNPTDEVFQIAAVKKETEIIDFVLDTANKASDLESSSDAYTSSDSVTPGTTPDIPRRKTSMFNRFVSNVSRKSFRRKKRTKTALESLVIDDDNDYFDGASEFNKMSNVFKF